MPCSNKVDFRLVRKWAVVERLPRINTRMVPLNPLTRPEAALSPSDGERAG